MSPIADHALKLSPEPASAGRARDFVREVCVSAGVDVETAEIARLVTSELVTNSIVHGSGEVELRVSVTPYALIGTVTDSGPGLPQLLKVPLRAERGRGLTIVAATTAAWGVRFQDKRKSVWFELSLGTR